MTPKLAFIRNVYLSYVLFDEGKPTNAEWAEDRKESYMAQVSRSVEIIAEDHYRFSLAN